MRNHRKTGIRLVSLLSSLFLAGGISGTALAACANATSCYRDAKAALVAQVRVWKDPLCGKDRQRGCIIISDAKDKRRAQPLPKDIELRTGPGLPFAYVAPVGERTNIIPPFVLDNVDLGPLGAAPAGGGTIIIVYYTGVYRPNHRLYSFFGAGYKAAGKTEDTSGVIALGALGDRLMVGRGGVPGQGHWLPLWDPGASLPRGATAWGALAATFLPNGKLRVDQVFSTQDNAFVRNPVTLFSSLIETGWPIKEFPIGRESKSYIPANTAVMGSMDYTGGQLDASVFPGLSQVYIFKKPLNSEELRAWFEATLSVSLQPDRPYDLNPCNTGMNLQGGDRNDAGVVTVCGMKESPQFDVLPFD